MANNPLITNQILYPDNKFYPDIYCNKVFSTSGNWITSLYVTFIKNINILIYRKFQEFLICSLSAIMIVLSSHLWLAWYQYQYYCQVLHCIFNAFIFIIIFLCGCSWSILFILYKSLTSVIVIHFCIVKNLFQSSFYFRAWFWYCVNHTIINPFTPKAPKSAQKRP